MSAEGLPKRLPEWVKKPLGPMDKLHGLKAVLRKRNLHTVCEDARCPNIGECFSKPTATFLILGNVCTRRCGFCSVEKTGLPLELNCDEPRDIALTAKEMGLRHVVITSVTRDDLEDGGAGQFALTIRAIKDTIPGTSVEVLTPDFKGDLSALSTVLDARPDIFNHNLETVPALYPYVRPGADYETSLEVLRAGKRLGATVKSGIMVGFGESEDEVRSVLTDLRGVGCDSVTIGQYLRPSKRALEVKEYVLPEQFEAYERFARDIGIGRVYSGPFVRSSYNAQERLRF